MEGTPIKIKCPCCSALLAVTLKAGQEFKTITCPVCREKSPFAAFRRITVTPQPDKTDYPQQQAEETTVKETAENLVLGVLKPLPDADPAIRLRVGRNIIGRKVSNSASEATIQLPTGESKRMSREHLLIEVKKVPGKGFVHYASLCKERCNPTLVNGDRMHFGDCIVLNHGDHLQLPDLALRFELPDVEETDV